VGNTKLIIKNNTINMKGIILAGGSGTRLHPLTLAVSKQLLPIYDKPMIYYPLSVLMLSGIKEILIISTPYDLPNFKKLFGDGSQFGLKLSYKEQPSPDGLAQAFILGEEFIGNEDVCLVLGDNIFYGAGLQKKLAEAVKIVENEKKAIIFGNIVKDPERYGIAEVDDLGNVRSLEEKPKNPKSNYAVVGLYYYPNSVIQIAKEVKPSHRGELEITSVNESYLKLNKLKLEILSRGYAWLDTGTHESLTEATEFVKAVEKRTGLKIACLEEIAYRMKLISDDEFDLLKKENIKSGYGEYLQTIH
jgi:glucose-1-phosphate thymidylyltransferase